MTGLLHIDNFSEFSYSHPEKLH